MAETLIHYSRAPLCPLRSVEQHREPSDKPRGLWVSVQGEDDWVSFCQGEEFRLDTLACEHAVTLAPGSRILRLANAADIDAFTRRHASDLGRLRGWSIDWRAVAAEHQGIIIAPYIRSRRLDGGANWYYGWDCASGCIWDAGAIEAVSLLAREAAA